MELQQGDYQLEVRLPIKNVTREEAIKTAEALIANLHLTGKPAVAAGNEAVLVDAIITGSQVAAWTLDDLNTGIKSA